MKRALILLVAWAVFSLLAASAFAESVDLSAMSIDELLTLRDSVDEELTNRTNATGSTIYEGVYVGGKDIKVGQYSFVCEAEDVYCVIHLFANEEDYKNDEPINNDGNTGYLSVGDQMYINVTEGMVISIFDGYGSLQSIKPSWAL